MNTVCRGCIQDLAGYKCGNVLKTLPLRTLKACGGGRGARFPRGLVLAVDAGEWSTSRRCRLSPVPIELDAGWGPRASFERLEKQCPASTGNRMAIFRTPGSGSSVKILHFSLKGVADDVGLICRK